MIDIDTRPESTDHMLKVLLRDKEWRMANLYWIKVKEPVADKAGRPQFKVKFRMNRAQRRLLKAQHTRNVILKARQLGFTTFIQIYMLDECLFTQNINAGVIAHNLDDAIAFFKDKIKYAYDNLPPFIQELIPATNDSARELRFANGSVIRVGTSLRSGTYQLLHVSEYGKLCAKYPDRALEVKTGAFPTVPKDGTIWVESTAEGRGGGFYEMSIDAQRSANDNLPMTDLDFKFHFFPWHEDPGNTLDVIPHLIHQYEQYFEMLDKRGIELTDGQRNWYAATAKTQGEAMKREHPSFPEEAFEAAIEGAYFARQMAQIRAKGSICRVPIEPQIPIHTFWDLGRDTTSIWFFQKVGFDYRFVDYYQNDGEWMGHYLQVLKDRSDGGEPYLYGDMYLPHDGDRKSMGSPDSPADVLYQNNYSVRIVQRTPAKDNSIERARAVLPKCYFDAERCYDGISCLDGYRKAWDDKLSTWKQQPLHDSNSHGADAFMTFADGFSHIEEVDEQYEEDHGTSGRNATTGY